MEIQIKKAVKAGNSSAVILPRSWLNQEVRVELLKKTSERILSDVISIVINHLDIKSIIGIYLTGSYARNEEDKNSDIDILVVTKNIDKEMISEGMYNIMVVSSELMEQKLKADLLPLGQMIRESEPLLNADYLSSLRVEVTKRNVEWYLKTTEDKLRIIKKVLDRTSEKSNKYLEDVIAYTLVLRIRTLYIIEKIIKKEKYSNKDFVKIIEKMSKGKNAYERYIAVKTNLKEKKGISLTEAERLCEYLEKELENIKRII